MTTKMPSVLNCRVRYALRALLHRAGDLLHLLGALAGREHRLDERGREAQRHQRDDGGDDDVGQVRYR